VVLSAVTFWVAMTAFPSFTSLRSGPARWSHAVPARLILTCLPEHLNCVMGQWAKKKSATETAPEK
jgi:hypothetical protein